MKTTAKKTSTSKSKTVSKSHLSLLRKKDVNLKNRKYDLQLLGLYYSIASKKQQIELVKMQISLIEISRNLGI